MTTHFALAPRFSLRAPRLRFAGRREAMALAALIAVAGLALVHHGRPGGADAPMAAGWIGQLPAGAPAGSPEVAPLTSSSLVVPSAELALPAVAAAPARVRNACDSADNACVIRPLPVAVPVKRMATVTEPARAPAKRAPTAAQPEPATKTAAPERSFSLLDHLPDAATIGHPFAAAGSLVSGWVKRL